MRRGRRRRRAWGRLGRNIPAASSARDAGPRAMGAFVAGASPLTSRARHPALAAPISPSHTGTPPLSSVPSLSLSHSLSFNNSYNFLVIDIGDK